MPSAQDHPLRSMGLPTILPKPEIHPRSEEIQSHVHSYLASAWEWPSTKMRLGFISWNLPDIANFMFAQGDFDRVNLACELLLLGFLMDDWFEHQTSQDSEHVVSRLWTISDAPTCFTPRTNIETLHHSIFSRILAQNPANSYEAAPAAKPKSKSQERVIIDQYMEMLACHCDRTRGEETSFHKYLSWREVDFGINICASLLYWTENLALSEAQLRALEPLERIANYHVMILNDIFSFDREWKAWQECGEAAAMVNGVSILAQETHLGAEAAKGLCFSLVRVWEREFQKIVAELKAAGLMDSQGVSQAVKGIERRMTGAEEFYWKTKRYH